MVQRSRHGPSLLVDCIPAKKAVQFKIKTVKLLLVQRLKDPMPYVLIVSGTLKPGKMEEFKGYFQPLAEHVNKNEEGCLTYQLSIGEENPDSLVIFERYISKAYLEQVHWASPEFKKFQQNVQKADMWVEKSASKYNEAPTPQFGFMAR
mmetsp:Transcript_28313/g.76469  ORF Transcript_28313/g.76469 Transcript_28313/m.76469 type:complete len:149 (-) Transcript_28313:424-870(-)